MKHNQVGCIVCQKPGMGKICDKHHSPYAYAWVVGERRDTLQRLVGSFKFQNAKAGANILAQLLHERVPSLPPETVIVPIPTLASHIRERGYDHSLLIARHFAKLRHLPLNRLVERQGKSVQKHANKEARIEQAQHAFHISKSVDPAATYLIIDDIITTGATLQSASELLRYAGANTIWVAALAHQPLD